MYQIWTRCLNPSGRHVFLQLVIVNRLANLALLNRVNVTFIVVETQQAGFRRRGYNGYFFAFLFLLHSSYAVHVSQKPVAMIVIRAARCSANTVAGGLHKRDLLRDRPERYRRQRRQPSLVRLVLVGLIPPPKVSSLRLFKHYVSLRNAAVHAPTQDTLRQRLKPREILSTLAVGHFLPGTALLLRVSEIEGASACVSVTSLPSPGQNW